MAYGCKNKRKKAKITDTFYYTNAVIDYFYAGAVYLVHGLLTK